MVVNETTLSSSPSFNWLKADHGVLLAVVILTDSTQHMVALPFTALLDCPFTMILESRQKTTKR